MDVLWIIFRDIHNEVFTDKNVWDLLLSYPFEKEWGEKREGMGGVIEDTKYTFQTVKTGHGCMVNHSIIFLYVWNLLY